MRPTFIILLWIAFACVATADTASPMGGMHTRFIEGYQMGYQHGFQDGYMKGQLSTPESIEEHKKAMEGHGTEPSHGMMESYDPKVSFNRFSEKLKLTPEQQEKVRPLLNAEVSEIQEIMADKTVLPEQKQRMIQQTIEKTHLEVNRFLTPEQQQIFKQMVEERRAMYGKMGEAMKEMREHKGHE